MTRTRFSFIYSNPRSLSLSLALSLSLPLARSFARWLCLRVLLLPVHKTFSIQYTQRYIIYFIKWRLNNINRRSVRMGIAFINKSFFVTFPPSNDPTYSHIFFLRFALNLTALRNSKFTGTTVDNLYMKSHPNGELVRQMAISLDGGATCSKRLFPFSLYAVYDDDFLCVCLCVRVCVGEFVYVVYMYRERDIDIFRVLYVYLQLAIAARAVYCMLYLYVNIHTCMAWPFHQVHKT